jgi:hypothetical protein
MREKMDVHELIVEMKLLERRLTLYEEKYGVLSEDFYNALMAGELEQYDAYDETRADFSRWKGIYEKWMRRKKAYRTQIQKRKLSETMRVQPAY